MHDLASVVDQHSPVLVLDAATTRMQAGLFQRGAPPRWAAGGDDAGVHLFAHAQQLLGATGLRPGGIGAFVLCDGPGSQLGIRTACMAVRTWQALRESSAPVFVYRSLQLAAHGERSRRAGPFAVIADARRDSWHVVHVGTDGAVGSVRRVLSSELAGGAESLLQPEGFRAWSKPPRVTDTISYDCATLWRELDRTPLLEATTEVSPWQSTTVEYQPWTGERHRGPQAQSVASNQQ